MTASKLRSENNMNLHENNFIFIIYSRNLVNQIDSFNNADAAYLRFSFPNMNLLFQPLMFTLCFQR